MPDLVVRAAPTAPRNAMGMRDLVLFCLVTGLSVRWIATAAAGGPSAITIWIGAWLVFYLPLLVAVLDLGTRFPDSDGGIYHWSRLALGKWAGFMTGWTYWTSVLPYYPSILVFAAGAAAFLIGGNGRHHGDDRVFVVGFSVAAMWLATLVNVVGLRVGKWLHNLGAVGNWGPVAVLVLLAAMALYHSRSATDWSAAALVPHVTMQNVVAWPTIVFALAGAEAPAFLVREVADARRAFPRALLIGGAMITIGYLAGTAAILVLRPAQAASGLTGIMDTVMSATQRTRWAALAPLVAGLLVVANVGAVGAWLTATARLPFVAGLDHYLPASFGRLHSRWGTPYVAFLWQAGLVTGVILLSQAGSTASGAYQFLVSMSIISYILPYVLTFVSLIRVQRWPTDAAVIRLPGGRHTARLMACIGLTVTLVAIVLACIPPADEPSKVLAVGKVVGSMIVLLGVGQVLYVRGERRRGGAGDR